MTPDQAQIHNAAIEAAAREYKNGIGAILALKVKYAVTVEYISPYQTRQDVTEVDGE